MPALIKQTFLKHFISRQEMKKRNKGLSVKKNIEAIRHIRQLKKESPQRLGYTTADGALHGFIHPTPWDTKETAATIQKTIVLYGLQTDILPLHSTPLIIHHASGLGDWIIRIEGIEKICFKRLGSIIAWFGNNQSNLFSLKVIDLI